MSISSIIEYDLSLNMIYLFLEPSSYAEPEVILRLEDKLEPNVFQQISEIENAYISHLKVMSIFILEFLI